MKTLVIGDTHFQISNIIETEIFSNNLINYVKNNDLDCIIFLGDILNNHEKLHSSVLNKACDLFNNLRKYTKVYIIVGNHDMCNSSIFLTTEHWMNVLKEWENIEIVDKPIFKTISNLNFILCPYVPNGKFKEALSLLNYKSNNISAIFCHQEFYGCKMGAFNSIEGDVWEDNDIFIVSGHIHLNHKPQKNIYYPGSSLSVAFGENSKNIIAEIIFTDINSFPIIKEIDLKLPSKKIYYIDFEQMEDFKIPIKKNILDKIKLSINGTYEEFNSFKKSKKYKDLINNDIKISFRLKNQLKQNNDILNDISKTEHNFLDILKNIITNENNKYLDTIYEELFV